MTGRKKDARFVQPDRLHLATVQRSCNLLQHWFLTDLPLSEPGLDPLGYFSSASQQSSPPSYIPEEAVEPT